MAQRVSDPSIVAVKLRAEENMVTYLRIKLAERIRKDKGKGMDMLTRRTQTIETTIMRSET